MRKLALFAAACALAVVTLFAAPTVRAEPPVTDEETADLVVVDEALVRQKVDQRLRDILRAKLRERADQRASDRR